MLGSSRIASCTRNDRSTAWGTRQDCATTTALIDSAHSMAKHSTQTPNGLSLIELIIVIALMGILAAFAVGAYQLFFERSRIDKATVEVALVLQKAQDLSISAHEGKEYGIRIHPSLGEYQLIYRASPVDMTITTYKLPNNISFLGVDFSSGIVVYFSKLTGLPSAPGYITLGNNEIQQTIFVNKTGVIEIE